MGRAHAAETTGEDLHVEVNAADRTVFENRRQRLKALLVAEGVPALLVSHPANRFYLSGFELHDSQCNESVGWLVITARDRDALFTDARFTDAALRLWPQEDLCIYGAGKHAAMGEFLKGRGVTCLGFDPKAVSVFDHERLREQFALVPAGGLVERLRLVKEPGEVELLRAACGLNHRIMRALSDVLVPGMSEAEAAWQIERLFREAGAEGLSFPSIVGVDKNAALPHAIPGDTRIARDCLVLVDAGCRLSGYCSDQTRTYWVGREPSERFQETKRLVISAQKAAMDVIKPGVRMAEAYGAAHRVFEDAGVAGQFTHSLGHGIGLETHEGPSLAPRTEGVFAPGMVVTVEPGLYDPAWGGVRWEYMVVVTEEGCKAL
ncbi:MAG: peptidase M24 family protein [Deltaproteobacteria bacterium HGW-Deltaproteobacteria-8]|nr:MAG: peptidase M24 family protein [Deltaproteobacteria bacterium HGW-Deltaproteobacteria-8]